MDEKIYGQWAVSTDALPLANADHILGARVSADSKGRPEAIDVQFRTADGPGGVRQVRMDFVNALFLLSLLKSIQLDSGSPFPDDPRAAART